jgi:hypothetical protein
MKGHRISEILYWIIAVISIYEAYSRWESNRDRAILFIGFSLVSIFMALFRRHYRNKYYNRSNSSE